jgi:hypothetical protein
MYSLRQQFLVLVFFPRFSHPRILSFVPRPCHVLIAVACFMLLRYVPPALRRRLKVRVFGAGTATAAANAGLQMWLRAGSRQ